MTPKACAKGPQIDSEPRSGPQNPSGRQKRSRWHWSRATDQAIWTATGLFLGYFLGVLTIFIYLREHWL